MAIDREAAGTTVVDNETSAGILMEARVWLDDPRALDFSEVFEVSLATEMTNFGGAMSGVTARQSRWSITCDISTRGREPTR